MKRIVFGLALCALTILPLSAKQNRRNTASINEALAPFEHIVVTNEAALRRYSNTIRGSIRIFDRLSIRELKAHHRYSTIGDVYMYYALLNEDIDLNAQIHGFERALEMRKDPDSAIMLATCYKEKWNNAILENNIADEKIYGKRIYELLDMFIMLRSPKDERWYRRRDYYEFYLNPVHDEESASETNQTPPAESSES